MGSTATRSKVKPPARGARPSRKTHLPFLVAVGASAGGLKALGEVLRGLPKEFPAPVVAVIHLDPDHRSHLAQLLQRSTSMRVRVAKSGQRLQPGCVYMAPPDRHLEIRGNHLALTSTARVKFSRPSVDRLFSSAAHAFGDHAIGLVLTGAGTDGSAGAADIKGAGGFVVAQDPRSAQFKGMPASAIATGCVDAVLSLRDIPAVLASALKRGPPAPEPGQWTRLFDLIRGRFGTDFKGYRRMTLARRLGRRMAANQQTTIAGYLALLRKDPGELDRLHSEFLIKVSSFFRDAPEWRQLARALRPRISRSPESTEFRIWSAGCATGEEAYSLAILFSEALAAGGGRRFKVFATDIDGQALATARAGVYGARQVEGLSPSRLHQHFHPEGAGWKVNKDLRQSVIFGRHDLLRDPPLSSLDLVACRNVLIYLTPQQGRNVLHRLVPTLKSEGLLFLGRSEGLRQAALGVEPVVAHARIFRHRAERPFASRAAANRRPNDRPTFPAGDDGSPPLFPAVAFRNLLRESTAAVAFGVSAKGRIVFWNGAAAALFGKPSAWAMGRPVAKVVGVQLWRALRKAMEANLHGFGAPRATRVEARTPETGRQYLDVDWVPFGERESSEPGVLFLAVPTRAHEGHAQGRRSAARSGRWVSKEQLADGEALESAHAELERLNEELQSTSEEQQTLNEELESRNEELETVNEELQSLNEELNTLNEEVGVRIGESARLAGFLRTILDLSPTAVIGCDSKSRVTFWNSQATKQFRLSEAQAVGQDLFQIVPVLDDERIRRLWHAHGSATTVALRHPADPSRWLDVRVGVVRDAVGRSEGYCLRIVEGVGMGPRMAPASGPASPTRRTRGAVQTSSGR